MIKKIAGLVLAVAMLAACGGGAADGGSASAGQEAPETIHVAGLKGPTAMGMVKLMDEARQGIARQAYNVEVFGAAPEVNNKLISGEVDIAAVPANVASVLYNATEGAVQAAAINTLGVLYVLENGEEIQSVADLAGRTIYSTGKGQTPEYALNYILRQNGLEPGVDVEIEYKSESTEVATLLAAGSIEIAVLPQPYATAVQMQNEGVRTALDLSAEWDKADSESAMVTGVLLVRTEFAQQYPEAVATFLEEYEASIAWVGANVEAAAVLVEEFGIVEKAAVAQRALPYCNIVYIDGDEMRELLGGYLQVLYGQNPEAVGGELPDDRFYMAR